MRFDFLFVPSTDDACLVPSDNCHRCVKEKLSYLKRWVDIPKQEIDEMIRYSIKVYRVRCICRSRSISIADNTDLVREI